MLEFSLTVQKPAQLNPEQPSRKSFPISQAIDPSSLKPQAPVDRMEKIAMTCNARKFLSLTVKPEDFSHIDDNIGKSSGKSIYLKCFNSRTKRRWIATFETHTRHTKRVMLTERKMPLVGKTIKSNDTLAPISIFATQKFSRNNAKVVRVRKKKKPFCAWHKTYKN